MEGNRDKILNLDVPEHTQLISSRIESLRPKLLDLTRKNPLISTKFSDKSLSFLRIINVAPELILSALLNNRKIKILSLPELENPLPDESTEVFETAFAEARLNDQEYLCKLEEIEQHGQKDKEEAETKIAELERQLKDRIREKLAFPPRQTKNSGVLSLQQHAKNHGISPDYDLPILAPEQKPEELNPDFCLYTLRLPEMFKRHLNSLISKENTWREETGISVLHIAFGFLEWQEANDSKLQYSPLILLPIQLEQTKTNRKAEKNFAETYPES